MVNNKRSVWKFCESFNYYLAGAVSSWLLSIMVVLSELMPSFKDLLTSLFTHHWIGKIIITASVFVLTGLLLKDAKKKIFGYSQDKLAWMSVLAGIIVITGFYVIHYILF